MSTDRKRNQIDFFFLYSMLNLGKVRIGDCMELFTQMNQKEEKKEKQSNSKEQQMQEVAQIYGISLSDIEEVHLENGKEYFKFYNPEDKTIRMIENRRDGKNLSEQFKEVQQTLSYSQGDNSAKNARAVFDYQLRYQNIELSLIPIRELKDNRTQYRYLFDNLDVTIKKEVRVLLENIDFLNLQYINVENSFGIDKNNRVIDASYNHQTGKCDIKAAEVRRYDDKKMSDSDADYTFDITDEEFDAVIADIDVSSDIPTIQEAEELNGKQNSASTTAPTIRGRSINMHFAIQAYQYPEIIERSEMADYDKQIYHGIIRAIQRKMAKRRAMTNQKQYQKQYVLKNKKPNSSQAAFVDALFLALLAGFFTGMTLLLVFSVFKNIF